MSWASSRGYKRPTRTTSSILCLERPTGVAVAPEETAAPPVGVVRENTEVRRLGPLPEAVRHRVPAVDTPRLDLPPSSVAPARTVAGPIKRRVGVLVVRQVRPSFPEPYLPTVAPTVNTAVTTDAVRVAAMRVAPETTGAPAVTEARTTGALPAATGRRSCCDALGRGWSTPCSPCNHSY